jgi:hypothetical protein
VEEDVMTNAQKFARVFGAIYVLVGILGFIPAVGGSTSQTGNELLGIFGINLLHNVVHIAVGAAFLVGSSSDSAARGISIAIGVVYLLVAVLGFMKLEFMVDLLAVNMADNILHVATAVLALYFGLAGRGAIATAT